MLTVALVGGNRCNHTGTRITDKRVFQDLCKLALSERCMALVLVEGTDTFF